MTATSRSFAIWTDPTGRSKGCALVDYATDVEAACAISQLSDTQLNGRKMFVREDRGTTSAEPRGQYRNGPSGPEADSQCVYVGNLPWGVEWHDLKAHMRQAGEVVQATVLKDPSGRSKGCGIVEFANLQGANYAIEHLTNTELQGRLIFVRADKKAGWAPAYRAQHAVGSGDGSCRLRVSNLDFKTKWFEVKDHFRAAGNVLHVDIATEDGWRSCGYGLWSSAPWRKPRKLLPLLNNSTLNGQQIRVSME